MEWLTVKQAAEQVKSSPSSIKRLITKYSIPTKKQGNKSNSAIKLSKRHLLEALANEQPTGQPIDQPVISIPDSKYTTSLETQLQEAKDKIERLESEKEKLTTKFEQRIEHLERKLEAAQEELKAHLRQSQKQPQSKGVFGFIVDQVWRDRK